MLSRLASNFKRCPNSVRPYESRCRSLRTNRFEAHLPAEPRGTSLVSSIRRRDHDSAAFVP